MNVHEVSAIFTSGWSWEQYSFPDGFQNQNPISWAAACDQLKQVLKNSEQQNDVSLLNNFEFDVRQPISCIPHASFMGYKTICFTLWIDGLGTRHQKHHSPSFTSTGFMIHNTKTNTQKHNFFCRPCFIPKTEHWSDDHILQILEKELSTFDGGIPCPDPNNPGKYHLVKFVNLGFVADGQELHVPLHHTGLNGYCGAFLVRDNIKETKQRIGTAMENAFIPRRMLNNTVCSFDISLTIYSFISSVFDNFERLTCIVCPNGKHGQMNQY